MNSMSKNQFHYGNDGCGKKSEGTKVLLKCGNPGSVILPVLAVGDIFTPSSYTLSSVNVDTSKFYDPCIKFDFTSNINTTIAGLLTLNFQLFKQCAKNYTPIAVGPIWTYSSALEVLESNTFNFFVCDCDLCPDECCTYFVVATIVGLAVNVGASITNATLSALVVENDHHCC